MSTATKHFKTLCKDVLCANCICMLEKGHKENIHTTIDSKTGLLIRWT